MAGKHHAVSQLERHYSRIMGDLQVIDAEIVAAGVVGAELRVRRQPEIDAHNEMLGHIEACVRLFEPDWTPDHITPVKARKPTDPDKWGRLLNWAYDVLRPATEPMSSADILDQLWRLDRISKSDREDFRARLTTLMRGQEKVGAVRSDGLRPLRWSIIKSPTRT